MARRFPLAGLLRLRTLEQDRAAVTLASANDRVRVAADARVTARRTLAEAEDAQPIQDAATLSAVAAARAATRGMLEELDAVVLSRRAEAAAAQAEYTTARRAALGLEKLEAKHVTLQTAADLRTEQNALDEIAARRRAEGGVR
ncbi:flagellar export protein FliJ [Curtobacterium sp. ISL-83]|uniref:flagellar export protein FliJ n=1 Tax=Curtobacterium sp. ISL-83 TaxID=2819145 RepID=UPI001BEC1DEB|nr:flagellar export protein FliJ [Curtobacterium sp. ISL-83]MBT2501017.1 flagellar export protein FliJ [Curtobacterium sp. ISL-83]